MTDDRTPPGGPGGDELGRLRSEVESLRRRVRGLSRQVGRLRARLAAGQGSGQAREIGRVRAEVARLRRRIRAASSALPPIREIRISRTQLLDIGKYAGGGAVALTVFTAIAEPYFAEAVKRWRLADLRDNYVEQASTIYFRDGNVDVAQDLIDEAVEVDPEDAGARYVKAYLSGMETAYTLLNLERPLSEGEQNDAHRALADAEFLINADADEPRGHLLRGQTFMALGRYPEAVDALERARSLARSQGRAAIQALAMWRLGSTILEDNSVHADRLARANRQMAEQPFDAAMAHFERSVELFLQAGDTAREASARKWPVLWRGIALRNERYDFDAAIEEFERALEIDPQFALAHYNVGEAYWTKWLNADRTEVGPRTLANWQNRAIEAFEAARRDDAGLAKAYYGLGMLFASDIKYGAALRYFDKAIRQDGNYMRALFYRGQTHAEMGQAEQAIANYDRAIALAPGDAQLYVHRARAEIERGRLTQARTDLEQAQAVGNANRYMELTQAELSLALAQPRTALRQLREAEVKAEAMGNAADFAEAEELRGRALLALGRQDAAVDAMTRAVDKSTYRPERFLLARGCLLQRIGLTYSALTDFSMARYHELEYRPAEYAETRILRDLGVEVEAPDLPEDTDPGDFWHLDDRYAKLCGFG